MLNKINAYFSRFEIALWLSSVLLVITALFAFDRTNYLSLIASLIGVTSLIFNAKGNPIGQLLMIVFSLLYGIISYSFSYYGEMMTYIGMTMPMAVIALVSWLNRIAYSKKMQDDNKKDKSFLVIIIVFGCIILFTIIKAHFDPETAVQIRKLHISIPDVIFLAVSFFCYRIFKGREKK